MKNTDILYACIIKGVIYIIYLKLLYSRIVQTNNRQTVKPRQLLYNENL